MSVIKPIIFLRHSKYQKKHVNHACILLHQVVKVY